MQTFSRKFEKLSFELRSLLQENPIEFENRSKSNGLAGTIKRRKLGEKFFTRAIKTSFGVAQNDLGTSDSPYRTAISGAILKLQEEGKLHLLKTRWWKEKRGGGSCRVSMQTRFSLFYTSRRDALDETYPPNSPISPRTCISFVARVSTPNWWKKKG